VARQGVGELKGDEWVLRREEWSRRKMLWPWVED
jgi:hypothetical protein